MEQTVLEQKEVTRSEMYSEFLSLVAIVCCVLAFYFYLQRLELPHLADSMWQDPEPVPETRVMATTLPFKIAPIDKPLAPASMKDGLLVRVEASTASTLHSFWGVKCQDLTEALRSCDQLHGSDDNRSLEDKLQRNSMLSNDELLLDASESREVHLKMGVGEDVDDRMEFDLGPVPRSRYPLVILVRRGPEGPLPEGPSVAIESVMWIFHLPDEIVTTPCHLISQLIITSQGRVCNLQKMFMASEGEGWDSHTETRTPPAPASESPSNENDSVLDPASTRRNLSWECSEGREQRAAGSGPTCRNMDKSCAVCQNAPITRAIVPCRHACVCHHCLRQLFLCPMCRGPIVSHFRLTRGPGSTDGDGEAPAAGREVDWVTRLQQGMERLNEWLGFV